MSTIGPISNIGNAGEFITVSANTGVWSSATWTDPAAEKFEKISERLNTIEERLAIVLPNEDLLARFPALKEAYDHYKLIEKLVNDQNK